MSGCIVGWAHSKFGKHEDVELEKQIDGAEVAGVFNMGGSAVANYVSVLEALR